MPILAWQNKRRSLVSIRLVADESVHLVELLIDTRRPTELDLGEVTQEIPGQANDELASTV